MAVNLAAAGHSVTGFDIASGCPESVLPAKSASGAVRGRDVILTMLPDGKALRNVAGEALPHCDSGSVFLDCSTVDIQSAIDVAADVNGAGLLFMDAPVSGGVVGAVNGTLTFMVGGPETAFEKVSPLFKVMGSRAVHCGSVGTGQAAKICNNMILGATMIVTGEAFGLADRIGLDRNKMFDVVSSSSGYSWSMNAYCPAEGVGPDSPADHGYRPGFASDLMLKDLKLAQLAADSSGLGTPIGRMAMEVYERFVECEGGSGLDFSAVIKRYEGSRE